MAFTGGYPAEADINTFLSARGIELLENGNNNFLLQFKQLLWRLLNDADAAAALAVYCPSSTTFNVRGGDYCHKGTVATYTPGVAIDPTNNDTTYIWIAANTVGQGIDGSGWPTTDHFKLAEIDVDSDGVITAVRDRRGYNNHVGSLDGNSLAVISASGGVPFILTAALTAGNTVTILNANAPFKFRVIDAWSVATSGDGGTWAVKNGEDAITNAVTVTGTDKTINRAGTIDDAKHEVAAGGSLSVAGDGANADAIVYIQCVRVS